MLKKISSILIITLLLIFFQQSKVLFLDLGFSWTLSYLLPYILLLLSGILLFKSYNFLYIRLAKTFRVILTSLLIALPFAVGFAIHPIYKGDVFGEGKILNNHYPEFDSYDLVLLTIPNCKYCHETVKNMNKLRSRKPRIRILYVVCSSNPQEVEPFRKKLDKKIDVEIASNLSKMTDLAGFVFPVYIIPEKTQITWYDNNNFGTRALDAIESQH